MKTTIVRAAVAALMLCAAAALALAMPVAQQPTQGKITVPPEELKAYEPIDKAATAADAITAAKAFIAKYPTSAALPQIEIAIFKKIFDSPKDETRLANIAAFKEMFPTSDRGVDLDRSMADYYLSKENLGEVTRVGEAYLAKHPDDVGTQVLLMQIGVEGAKRGDAKLVTAGLEHAKRAVALLEAPTRPANVADEAEWQKYKADNLGLAYQSYGILSVATGDAATAREYLTKAAAAKPTDPLNYLFLASIKEGEYEPLAKAYNSAIDKSSADAKKKLEAVNAIVDEMIPLYAKAVVLSEGNAQYAAMNQSAREALEGYYKLRHDGKLDGLDAVLTAARGPN